LTAIKQQHEQHWLEIAEGELLQKFSGEFAPLCRITLLQASEKFDRNELIVTFHHAIADGISALHLIHELLSYYQQLVEGRSISPMDSLPLLPSLEQLLKKCLSEMNPVDFPQATPSQTSSAPTLLIEFDPTRT
jgi:Condensation domain